MLSSSALQEALSGSPKSNAVISVKNSETALLQFSVVGKCEFDHWTLEHFQMSVDGIQKYRIIVGSSYNEMITVGFFADLSYCFATQNVDSFVIWSKINGLLLYLVVTVNWLYILYPRGHRATKTKDYW